MLPSSQLSNQSLNAAANSNDPVYDLLRKAVDVRQPMGTVKPTSADRSWTQVMGQMGILPPHMGPLSNPPGQRLPFAGQSRSSASPSSSAHLLSVINQPSIQNCPASGEISFLFSFPIYYGQHSRPVVKYHYLIHYPM